jgi:hypothetical protein
MKDKTDLKRTQINVSGFCGAQSRQSDSYLHLGSLCYDIVGAITLVADFKTFNTTAT